MTKVIKLDDYDRPASLAAFAHLAASEAAERGEVTLLTREDVPVAAVAPFRLVLIPGEASDLGLQAVRARSTLRWLGEQLDDRLSAEEHRAVSLVIAALDRELPAVRQPS